MARVRKDTKGRVLHKGETYNKSRQGYVYTYTDSFGKRRFIYARDLGELREKEKQTKKDELDGISVYALSQSDFNYVFDRYIATKSELRSSTRSNYIYNYNRYVRKGFGKKKISEIRYSDVIFFYNALLQKGLAMSTVEIVHGLLHPTFQMAVRDNIIRSNPSDNVMAELKKKQKGRPEPRRALTYEQQRAFLDFLDRPEYIRWKPMFTVMFGTGVRVGELIALRWDDVDFDDNKLSIRHDITYCPRVEHNSKCEYKIDNPKTEAGKRDIPLLDKVKEAFLAEKAYQEETGNHCVMELGGFSGFIFCNRFGNFHNQASINREIKRIVNDHNAREQVNARREGRQPLMIPSFSCHITRHTFCTRLCENETNIKVIQTIMGHKDIQTTLDIYAEVSESKKQDVFRQLNHTNVV